MDPPTIWLLIAYIALIALSAFFSASETAYSTASRVRLRTLEAAGNKKAGKALKTIDNYDRLLSTLLVGNNIVNITAASIATLIFADLLASRANLAVTVSTIVTTVMLLIFGEITPKSVAKERPEAFCMLMNPIVRFFCMLLTPVNALFMLWKKLLKSVFRLSRDSAVTEDELKTYVETAENDGEITGYESQLIRSAIEFDDLDIYDIMTPRVSVVAVEENADMDEVAAAFREHGYSRLPVYSGTIDSVIGAVHQKDFYELENKSAAKLKDILKPIVCVSRTMRISASLRLMQKEKVHMAVVVDEFGGTSGIVTMEDIIEELVGEIWDEHDEEEILIKKIDGDTYAVSGLENLETMFETLGQDVREEFASTTVGGFVIEKMERIPISGESFDYQNLTVTVTKATHKKVVEVKVKINPQEEEDE
ncbi:MAG: hemolysin family protein [Clostridiales bacterium]|jgi:CBS domain containing-hemolysin-like protein|nr:hemolysin family protein [Clostridiales bacterium]